MNGINRICFFILLVLVACQEDAIMPNNQIKDSTSTSPLVQKGMDTIRHWYYWADNIPTDFPTENYTNLSELLRGVEHPQDRYSSVFDLDYIRGVFLGTPEDFGFGGTTLDDFGSIVLGYVYKSSPAGEAGLTRGCKILMIDDQTPKSYGSNLSLILTQKTLKFLVQFPDETTKEITLTQKNYKIDPILHYSVIEQSGKRIAYLVLNSFIGVEDEELDEVFSEFKAQNVTDLILDLRYNGGGYLSTVNHVANLVIPQQYHNYAFVMPKYNSTRQAEYGENVVTYVLKRKYSSLDIRKLVVITTKQSASGSEVLINNLRPYMTVKTVGSQTYGKPTFNRLYEIENSGLYLTLGITGNVQGKANYFEGIPADGLATDDNTLDFGNLEEASLKEALYYLENGGFSDQMGRTEPKSYLQKPFVF